LYLQEIEDIPGDKSVDATDSTTMAMHYSTTCPLDSSVMGWHSY